MMLQGCASEESQRGLEMENEEVGWRLPNLLFPAQDAESFHAFALTLECMLEESRRDNQQTRTFFSLPNEQSVRQLSPAKPASPGQSFSLEQHTTPTEKQSDGIVTPQKLVVLNYRQSSNIPCSRPFQGYSRRDRGPRGNLFRYEARLEVLSLCSALLLSGKFLGMLCYYIFEHDS